MKVKKSRKIKSLTDHEKLINLIAVQGEKDISKLLSSIDRVFIELFNLKESELPWLNTNTDKEWDDFMRKSRLAFYRIYFELIQKRKGSSLMDKITEIRIEEVFDEENDQHYYWIYYFKNEKVKIIGKSSVKPQCYKQIARYIK